MKDKSSTSKKRTGRILYYILLAVLILLVVNKDAKTWVLKQLVSTGIFTASIEQPKKNRRTLSSAHALTYFNEQGQAASTSDLQGKVVFINFWASWCPPCRAEMPSLAEMYQRLKNDTDYAFIFINMDDQAEKGRSFLEKNHYNLPFHRVAAAIPDELYQGSLPTTVVLNKQGARVMKHSGMANYAGNKFMRQLKELAAE